MNCPECNELMTGIQYGLFPSDHPEHYDGVSEWSCACGCRIGRWTGKRLADGECEKLYGCKGE